MELAGWFCTISLFVLKYDSLQSYINRILSEGKRKMADKPSLYKDNGSSGRIYDFQAYRKRKPFFQKPMKITLGEPINDTYSMVKNIQFNEKQIFAMKSEHDSHTIILVEATLKDGRIHSVSKLSQENIDEIRSIFETSN